MAGVNLSEESARILATNSELVGTLTRSCKDETFLLPAPLQRRILEIGTALGCRAPCVGLVWTTTVCSVCSCPGLGGHTLFLVTCFIWAVLSSGLTVVVSGKQV